MQVISPKEAINSGLPTMFDLKEFGKDAPKAFLVNELTRYIEFVRMGKSMNATQIMETADLMLLKYSNLNMADYKLFFQNCKFYHYGKLFDLINGAIILDWLEQFKTERLEVAETQSIRMHSQQKQQEKEIGREADISQEYINAIKSLLTKKAPHLGNDTTKGEIMDSSPVSASNNERIQAWMKEFDILFIEQSDPFKAYPIRYVEIEGRHYDQNQFLTLKLADHEE